jgi:hypothetical protein
MNLKLVKFQHYAPWHKSHFDNQSFVDSAYCLISICGYVVSENNAEIVIAQGYSKRNYFNQSIIPKQCIVEGSFISFEE